MGRVPGCGRRGEAHRGNGHGGAPTAAGKRARDGGDLWRRCSGVRAARERWKRGPLERKWGRGRGRVGLGAQVARGGSVASSTRDVGAEKAGARSSGGGYARTRELTSRAREQRERGERRRARVWAGWAERPRGRLGWASLPFSFILNCFSLFFLPILFDSNPNKPQIQIRLSKNYAPSKSEI